MGEVEAIKLDLPPAIKELAVVSVFAQIRVDPRGEEVQEKHPCRSPTVVSLLSLLHFQLDGLLLTGQLVCCQLTALTKKDLLNTDSFHLH